MTDIAVFILILCSLLVLLAALVFRNLRKERPAMLSLPRGQSELLSVHVPFYRQLDDAGKKSFESRMQRFLLDVRITGVKVEVTDLDRVLIAASAVIPIFAFHDWEYINLREVLLYPDSFSEEFEQVGEGRSVLGMVGSGPMQNVMILSQHELRQGFLNRTGKSNVAIHEFVHLLDKTDGATDGIPESLMERQYVLPWLKMMQKSIAEIIGGHSDINPYGTTNEAEFFAVAAEYFFERPALLKEKHPGLYALLERIFRQDPGATSG